MARRDAVAMVRRLFSALTAAAESQLMPRRCVFCGVTCTVDERHVCDGCHADLPWIRHACPVCALELPAPLATARGCAACQARPPPFSAAAAPLAYAFPVDAALKALKFRRRLYFAPAFAELMLPALDRLRADVDGLLPVPLHRLRLMRRGCNQAMEIAKLLSKATGLPLVDGVARVVATPYQSGLDARARRSNLKGAFRVTPRMRAHRPLIVDDVITTGETCRQLARALLDAGAEQVSVLALARA